MSPPQFRGRSSSKKKKSLKQHKSSNSLICPTMQQLKDDFDAELNKFLASLHNQLIIFRAVEDTELKPLEMQLRLIHKQLTMLDLNLKSAVYWRRFYKEYIQNVDEIMNAFKLTDFRPIEIVVQSFPDVLKGYVSDNLKIWREYHASQRWTLEYLKEKEEVERLQAEVDELELKKKIIGELLDFAEEIPADAIEIVHDRGSKRWFEEKIGEIWHERENELKKLPSVTRKKSTKEWHSEHYGTGKEAGSLSDEELSSLHSSLNVNGDEFGASRPPSVGFPIEDDEDSQESLDQVDWNAFFGDE